jgi:hypothetical protein
MASHMELVSTFNTAIFVAMTILRTLLQPLVASQAEVGTESCAAFRHRSLALGTFQLESISHKDHRTRFERKTCVTLSQERDSAISGLVRPLERAIAKPSIGNELREEEFPP